MEDLGENIFQKQALVSSKIKIGKPPTRLQRQAPASLQLDHVSSSCYANPNLSVIPLLSPLVVSPESLPEAEDFRFPKCDDSSEMSCSDQKKERQHAAIAGYAETSTLFNHVFQSKCVLVNDAQWVFHPPQSSCWTLTGAALTSFAVQIFSLTQAPFYQNRFAFSYIRMMNP